MKQMLYLILWAVPNIWWIGWEGLGDILHIFPKILPCLLKNDPLNKLSDVVLFCGASNVQKYGKKLAARYP